MTVARPGSRDLEIHPVTPRRWNDLTALFERPGPKGGWSRTGACYCMFWRLEPSVYEKNFRERSLQNETGGPNKSLMRAIVATGGVPGLLAYRDGRPVGWVAVSPSSELVRLEYSRELRADDDSPATKWSISCFYVHRSESRAGVGTALLEAAVARARGRGASLVEGYPNKAGSVDPYTGYDTMFARAGFTLHRRGRGMGRAVWQKHL